MIVAISAATGKPEIKFDDTTEAGIWAKLPTPDIEVAIKQGEALYGYRYEKVDQPAQYEHILSWKEREMGERVADCAYALSLVTRINREGLSYDIRSAEFLTPQQIYDKYWQGLTVFEIFESMTSAIDLQNKLMDHLDQEKKELQQLVITQAETNSRGEKCVYVPMEDAIEVINTLKEEAGLEGEVAIKVWEEEGYIGKGQDGVCYFAVKELVKPFSIEEWRGEKANKSK